MTSIRRDMNEVTIKKIRELVTRTGKGNSACPYCGQERTFTLYGIPQSLIDALKVRKDMTY